MNYGIILSELEGSGTSYIMVFDTVRTIVHTQDADVQAVVATIDVDANQPSVNPEQNAIILAQVATVQTQAIPPSVNPVQNADIRPVVATVTIQANAPIVSPVVNADILGKVATVSVQAQNPTVVPTSNADIHPSPAQVTVIAGTPTVGIALDVSVVMDLFPDIIANVDQLQYTDIEITQEIPIEITCQVEQYNSQPTDIEPIILDFSPVLSVLAGDIKNREIIVQIGLIQNQPQMGLLQNPLGIGLVQRCTTLGVLNDA